MEEDILFGRFESCSVAAQFLFRVKSQPNMAMAPFEYQGI
jgi:hypothetical protein